MADIINELLISQKDFTDAYYERWKKRWVIWEKSW